MECVVNTPQQDFVFAMDEIERQLMEQVQELQTQAATISSGIDDLNDLTSAIFGNPDTLRDNSTYILPDPKNIQRSDLEYQLEQQSGLTVIAGNVFLPGKLDLSAVKRLYGILGSVDAITTLIPEIYTPVSDPQFGQATISTRLIVLELRVDTTSTFSNPCDPTEEESTYTQTLVSINKPFTENEEKIVIAIWIGDVVVTSSIRQYMSQLGFMDNEISDLILMKSNNNLEVYQIKDPVRIGNFFLANSKNEVGYATPVLDAILERESMTSVNDYATQSDKMQAVMDAITKPVSNGCGVPPAISLISVLAPYSLNPNPEDECPDQANAYKVLNDVFGAMGIIQKVVTKIQNAFQKGVATVTAKLSDYVSLVESLIPSFGISVGPYSADFQIPGIPTPSPPVGVNMVVVDQLTTAINQRITFFQDFVNAGSSLFLGVSLLACSASSLVASAFNGGNSVHSPSINFGLPVDNITHYDWMSKCERSKIKAHLDLHALNADLYNQVMQQLQDVMNRLYALLNTLLRLGQGSRSLFGINCQISQTVQLGISVAQRLQAQNFGSFTIDRTASDA